MKTQENDYVICRSVDNANKNFLGQVIKVRKDGFVVTEEKDRHFNPNNIEVENDQLVLNLGEKPPKGKILGFDTENLYRKSKEHPIWGSIHYFRPMHKQLGSSLSVALDKTGDRLVSLGFEKLFDKFVFEVRAHHGQYSGMYIYVHGEKKPSRLQLNLKDDHASEMAYILYHEFGHAIRKHCLNTPGVHASWTKLFRTTVQSKPIEASTFKRLLKAIVSVDPEVAKGYTTAELINSTEEDDILAFRMAVRHMTSVYHITIRDFRSLVTAGKFDLIESIWPDTRIEVDDLKPLISEYSTKNVEELFAEAFAFRMVGKKIPKVAADLLEKSLTRAKDFAKNLDIKDE